MLSNLDVYLPTQPVRGMSIAGILPGMPMMSSGFSVDEAKKDIYQIGFHVIEDPALGSAFEQMTKDEAAFDISSDTGFEFCFKFVLSEPVGLDLFWISVIELTLSAGERDAGRAWRRSRLTIHSRVLWRNSC